MDGDRYDLVVQEYKPKLLALAKSVQEDLLGNFQISQPEETNGDTFSVMMIVGMWKTAAPTGDDIHLSFSIEDKADYDGDEGGLGINFRMSMTAMGGLVVGILSPYNYTEKCWVNPDDKKAMRERWKIFEEGCKKYDYTAAIRNHEPIG